MDARKLSKKVIIEAIENKAYEFTGISKDGEVILAIVGDSERKILNYIFNEKNTDDEKLMWIRKAIDVRGRNAQEYMQIYLQNIAPKDKVCKVNGLRIK